MDVEIGMAREGQGPVRRGLRATTRRPSAGRMAAWRPWMLLVLVGCASPAPAPPASPATLERQRAEVARSLVETGRTFASEGDSVRAEQYFRAALGAGAPARDVLPQLISVCVEGQRYRAAIAPAREYLREHPSDWRLRLVLANLLSGLGDYTGAVEELVQVVSLEPDHVLGHYALGVLYRDQLHQPERADQAFRTYLQLAPGGSHVEEARASLLQFVPAN
jgi:Flp pilus assembly protein TadD